ncbi:MAG: ClbS/DfsB family four-helix bundle protein [Chloroflexota bacterium]
MQTTAEAIIKQIEQRYLEVRRLYQDLPVAALTEPALSNGWSFKDTVAHLAAWDRRSAELLDVAHNSDVPLKAHPAVDALNWETYQERRNWSWEEVEFDFREAFLALIKAIQTLPPERLNDKFIQASIAEETWEHYEQHLRQLRERHEQIKSKLVALGR